MQSYGDFLLIPRNSMIFAPGCDDKCGKNATNPVRLVTSVMSRREKRAQKKLPGVGSFSCERECYSTHDCGIL